MRRNRAMLLALLLSATGLVASCAHAPPATGSHGGAGAGGDPDYPEQNCGMNNTVDCRPAGGS